MPRAKKFIGSCISCGKPRTGKMYCSRHCAAPHKTHHPPKMNEMLCLNCGIHFSYRANHAGKGRKYCSDLCRQIASIGLLAGENNPNWKGGEFDRGYASRSLIAKAKKRIGKCERCGNTERLHGHHQDKYSEKPLFRALEDNIEIICAPCHALEHPELAAFILSTKMISDKKHLCKNCGVSYHLPRCRKGTKYCSNKCKYNAMKGQIPWQKRSGYPQRSVGQVA